MSFQSQVFIFILGKKILLIFMPSYNDCIDIVILFSETWICSKEYGWH